MNITEQVIVQLYASAERQQQATETESTVVSDYVVAHKMLRNESAFKKDYGLISAFTVSRFNANDADWTHRRNLSQKNFATVSMPDVARFIEGTPARVFSPDVLETRPELRNLCLEYAANNLFRVIGHDRVPDGYVDWVVKVRPFVQMLQVKTLEGQRAAPFSASEKQALLEELRAIIRPELKFYDKLVGALGEEAALEEAAMLLFGGVESTATTILWCLEMLGRGKPYQDIVRAADASERAALIEAFVNETMRRFPAIPLIVRAPLEDWSANGRHFAAGQPVMISIIGIHHDERNWKEPFLFDYRREAFLKKTVRNGAFMPFSRGLRTCAGARLATDEIKAAVLHFVENFEIEQPCEQVGFDYGLTLNPTTYGHIRFRPLDRSEAHSTTGAEIA